MFAIKNKVALITGGCGGIGAAFAKALLECGARGVVLADINEEIGKKLEDQYLKQYGPNKVTFVKTDVAQIDQLKNAFDRTINVFNQLDIVSNDAGIVNEINIEKSINVNLTGSINSCLIARELLPTYKLGAEAVIVNNASVSGILPVDFVGVYGATKAAVIHYSRAIGGPESYAKYKTKIITICGGPTDTDIILGRGGPLRIPTHDRSKYTEFVKKMIFQSPSELASVVKDIIMEAESGSVWIVDSGKKKLVNFPNLYEFPNSK